MGPMTFEDVLMLTIEVGGHSKVPMGIRIGGGDEWVGVRVVEFFRKGALFTR